jgi:hypothetical protein
MGCNCRVYSVIQLKRLRWSVPLWEVKNTYRILDRNLERKVTSFEIKAHKDHEEVGREMIFWTRPAADGAQSLSFVYTMMNVRLYKSRGFLVSPCNDWAVIRTEVAAPT